MAVRVFFLVQCSPVFTQASSVIVAPFRDSSSVSLTMTVVHAHNYFSGMDKTLLGLAASWTHTSSFNCYAPSQGAKGTAHIFFCTPSKITENWDGLRGWFPPSPSNHTPQPLPKNVYAPLYSTGNTKVAVQILQINKHSAFHWEASALSAPPLSITDSPGGNPLTHLERRKSLTVNTVLLNVSSYNRLRLPFPSPLCVD